MWKHSDWPIVGAQETRAAIDIENGFSNSSFFPHRNWIFWHLSAEYHLILGNHFETADLGQKSSLWLWNWADFIGTKWWRDGEGPNSNFRFLVSHGIQPPTSHSLSEDTRDEITLQGTQASHIITCWYILAC